MERLGGRDRLRNPLDPFAPRLASVCQPRQRTALQNIQKLWLLLATQKKQKPKERKYYNTHQSTSDQNHLKTKRFDGKKLTKTKTKAENVDRPNWAHSHTHRHRHPSLTFPTTTDLGAWGGACQLCPTRVGAQNILQVLIPRLQLCTTQRPHTRRVWRGQV